MDAEVIHRLHFAFTVTYHYLFPQLTMGLAPLIVILKSLALWRGDERYNHAARFWMRIFAINFLFGVITGIPMEFQFGTNWAEFAHYSGGVIATTLAMEGVFAFFLESSFLGLFLFGERRLGPRWHWVAAFMVFLGSWLSGYFIIVTNAWMQHPVGYEISPDGVAQLTSFWALLTNPWAIWQYLHNMNGAVITAAFVMAAVGAFYLLAHKQEEYGRLFLKTGVIAALVCTLLQLYPLGDAQGRMVARHQPATLAAMEGLFRTEAGAPIVIIGQPDVEKERLDNPITVPKMLSFLTYRRWEAEVKGLDAFPRDQWPDNIPLLYYSYHIMVGLGTIFIAIAVVAAFLLWRKRLYDARWMLWILMLSFPFPYIANTAGWMTAELGRQPWLVYGLMRTSEGYSPTVSAGNGMFTLIGFMGMYLALGILFLFLIWREIEHGPKFLSVEPSAIPPSAKILPETGD
ncbi:MAG: cytochrome ubiquinol oxidase subunit I [Pyrinomonas sp.]|uniref:cytochrome ubiquinol oxidase subunit I n=1 Tax=Pyrinomonas sp. TaxID=2080306 RepID=UPI00332406AC